MANFRGTVGVTEIEAKVARIIDDQLQSSDPESFRLWIKINKIICLDWWDYFKTKKSDADAVLVPFYHFEKIGMNPVSMHYLKLKKETALAIIVLGCVPTF